MSSVSKQSFGKRGEKLAVEYLKRQGYSILTTNWRCKGGEIDIVAQKAEMLIFVEVRTRHSFNTESAFESITPHKSKRMVNAAHTYAYAHNPDNLDWRIDMIGIAFSPSGDPILDYAEDVLSW